MYLERWEWIAYTTWMLGAFGLGVFAALRADGDGWLWMTAGILWGWNLTRWAESHRERKRGWRVIANETDDGVDVFVLRQR